MGKEKRKKREREKEETEEHKGGENVRESEEYLWPSR